MKITDGKKLVEDMDSAELTAYRIRHSSEWDPDDCRHLCELADMEDDYNAADGDTVEEVISKAADTLGVEIW